GADLTRPQRLEIVATTASELAAAAIRRLAQVPIGGTSRIDLDVLLQACRPHLMAEDRLGGWGSTDIAQADEQDFHVQAPSNRRTRSRPSGVSTPAGGASPASATWIRRPCQRARSCSRHSVASSQQGP